jgi:hypothetical protein
MSEQSRHRHHDLVTQAAKAWFGRPFEGYAAGRRSLLINVALANDGAQRQTAFWAFTTKCTAGGSTNGTGTQIGGISRTITVATDRDE